MRRRGFTLIELMGVLIIIGVLSLIIIPVISNVLKEQKEKQYEQQIEFIELATKNFGSANLVILPSEENEYMNINVGQLKSMGYLDQTIVNPITEEEISDCALIKITKIGNNHTYEYDQTTESATDCDISGIISISNPTDRYIKSNETTSYLITINDDSSDDLLNKYEINKSKIVLTGTTDAKFSVIEGKNAYRIFIRGGLEEGEVTLKLESEAILRNELDDLVGSEGITVAETVFIDNTIPTITFGTNGSSSYIRQASTTVTATDDSGIKSISYGWSTSSNSTTIEGTVTSGQTLIKDDVTTDGNYYLYVKACDNSDNCTEERTAAFMLDVTPPTISRLEHYSCMAGIGMYYTIEDTTSGIVKFGQAYCLNNDNDCYNSIGVDTNWSTPATIPDTTKRQYHGEWTMCVSTIDPPVSGQGYKAYLIVEDAAGNVAKLKNDKIVYPYQGSGCNWCEI